MDEPKVICSEHLGELFKTISDGMQKAIDEDPEGAKTWTSDELFEKGANWCGRNILITEKKDC